MFSDNILHTLSLVHTGLLPMAVHHVKQATFGGAAAAAVDVKYFLFFSSSPKD